MACLNSIFLRIYQLLAVMCLAAFAGHEVIIQKENLAVLDKRIQENIEASGLLVMDPDLTGYIENCLSGLLDQSGKESVAGRIHVLNSPELNAFSLSNGSIYISLAVLGLMDNEAQLVFLLAHEFMHIKKEHHIAFRYTLHEQALRASQNLIAASIFGISIRASDFARTALAGFSQAQEYEADSLALMLVAKNGYNAFKAKELLLELSEWLKFKERKIDRKYATHPKLSDRFRKCTKQILRINPDSLSGIVRDSIYREKISPYTNQIVSLLLMSNSTNELYLMAGRKTGINGKEPQWHCLRGKLLGLYFPVDSFPRAISFLKRSRQLDFSYSIALREMGFLFLKRDDADSARFYFERYLAEMPDAEDKHLIQYYMEDK